MEQIKRYFKILCDNPVLWGLILGDYLYYLNRGGEFRGIWILFGAVIGSLIIWACTMEHK